MTHAYTASVKNSLLAEAQEHRTWWFSVPHVAKRRKLVQSFLEDCLLKLSEDGEIEYRVHQQMYRARVK